MKWKNVIVFGISTLAILVLCVFALLSKGEPPLIYVYGVGMAGFILSATFTVYKEIKKDEPVFSERDRIVLEFEQKKTWEVILETQREKKQECKNYAELKKSIEDLKNDLDKLLNEGDKGKLFYLYVLALSSGKDVAKELENIKTTYESINKLTL